MSALDLDHARGMTEFRSGFVAVLGRPNVGKSTLINSLLGQKIAAVSPRPQTTRRRQLGILTLPELQLVFVDTPGVHEPRHKLGEFMNQEAEAALQAVDVILFLVDLTSEPTEDDERLAATLRGLRRPPPIILVGNKIDLMQLDAAEKRLETFRLLVPMSREQFLICATEGQHLDELVQRLASLCPVRAPEFDEDQITDIYEKDIAADLVREAALLVLRDEVPHGVAVRVEEYKERDNAVDYIRATMLVERDSQKAIVIGQGGKMLKQIGTMARREIEKMTGRRAFLELRVKVEKGWRNRESVLEQLGYKVSRK